LVARSANLLRRLVPRGRFRGVTLPHALLRKLAARLPAFSQGALRYQRRRRGPRRSGSRRRSGWRCSSSSSRRGPGRSLRASNGPATERVPYASRLVSFVPFGRAQVACFIGLGGMRSAETAAPACRRAGTRAPEVEPGRRKRSGCQRLPSTHEVRPMPPCSRLCAMARQGATAVSKAADKRGRWHRHRALVQLGGSTSRA
jgi:hypothetical protein